MDPHPPTCYDLLGLSLGAPAEQVDRAYRFYCDLYGENSLATYSLLTAEELLAARARVQEAYEVLSDPGRRRDYDAALGLPAAVASAPPSTAAEPAAEPLAMSPPPAAVEAAPEPSGMDGLPALLVAPPLIDVPATPAPTPEPPPLPDPVTGAALRAYRVAKGVSLRDIANQSKIGVRFLEYLEADRFRDLPAPVYLRGFLREYARACGLEPARIADSYLSRWPAG